MRITVNQKERSVQLPCTIQQLINEMMGEKQKGIAVAVNNAIVSRHGWEQHQIQPDDNILIIKATQGG